MVRHKVPDSSRTHLRPSAVSQALRSIRLDEDPGPVAATQKSDFNLLVARDDASRDRAYRLAYRVYRASGFADSSTDERCVNAFDARPDTFVLLVEDTACRAAATVTLVFDGDRAETPGLPCDEIFAEELAPLRREGRKLTEVARLVMAPEQAGGKTLLLSLFRTIFAYTYRIRKFDDFVIEVNPRHAPFYQRLLCFDLLGPERPCPRVNNAPARLLRLNLKRFDEQVRNLQHVDSQSTRHRDLKFTFAPEKISQAEAWLSQTTPSLLSAIHHTELIT